MFLLKQAAGPWVVTLAYFITEDNQTLSEPIGKVYLPKESHSSLKTKFLLKFPVRFITSYVYCGKRREDAIQIHPTQMAYTDGQGKNM